MKSAFQLINRGRNDKPCWTVEKSGRYVYSNRSRSIAEGMLRLCRRDERAAITAAKVTS